jgi:hypothetical protein
LQQRDKQLSYAVSSEFCAGVAHVLTPGLPDIEQVGLQLAAPRAQQRPDDLSADLAIIFDRNSGMNACNSPQPRSANHPQQHGFRLVIESVSGDNLLQVRKRGDVDLRYALFLASLSKKLSKESIPEFARSGLDADLLLRSMLAHIASIGIELQTMFARKSGNELLIRIRLGPAQLVIEMNDREDNPHLIAQLEEKAQQGDRVDAGRDSYSNAIACLQQLVTTEVREQAFGQCMHCTMLQPGVT